MNEVMTKYKLKIALPELPGDVKVGDILTTKESKHGTYLMKNEQPICNLGSLIAQQHCELMEV